MKTSRERRLLRGATWAAGWIIGWAALVGYAAETPADIKEFDIAYDKAVEAADEMEGAQAEMEFARQEDTPDAKRIAELKATLEAKRADAFAWSERAIALADAKSNVEKLNLIRYMLCYFHYAKGNYYEAAVLGEFLAKKYPDAAKARPAAQVALHALDTLYREQKPASDQARSFELTKLLDLADYVVTRWPEEPETGPAAALLMQFDIAAGDLTKARATLNRLPQDSPARGEAEVKLGHALWSSYLRKAQQLREDDPKTKPELDALLKQAQQSLEQGVAAIRKGKEQPNQRSMLAVLSLAQLYGNTSQAEKAVALLEDAKLGPLTLLKENHPAARSEGVPAEIYKTAARAYLGTRPPQVEKATASLEALERVYGSDAQGQARLLQMLVGAAYELQQQLDGMARAAEADRLHATSFALEKLLRRIADRAGTADFKTLNWVAAAYENLAGKIAPGEITNSSTKLPDDAEACYRQAIKVHEAILSRAKQDAEFVSTDDLLALKRRLSVAYRAVGEYDKAIAKLAEILKQRPTLLAVQAEAARTVQHMASLGKPESYQVAIVGSGKGDAAGIWGWGKLAKETSRDIARFRDNFHEARLNIALCHKLFAETRTETDAKRESLERAKRAILETKQFESALGGEKWKPQYDSLLREIQKALGEPVVGLLAFESKADADAAPNTKK